MRRKQFEKYKISGFSSESNNLSFFFFEYTIVYCERSQWIRSKGSEMFLCLEQKNIKNSPSMSAF